MPTFKIKTPDGRTLTIKADDEASAMRGAKEFVEANPLDTTATVPEASEASGASFGEAAQTWAENFTEGVPVLGPALRRASDFATSQIAGRMQGVDPAEIQSGIDERRAARSGKYPATSLGAQLTGNVASLGALSVPAAGANALGMTGTLGTRIANSAASGAGIAMADSMVRGESTPRTLAEGAFGAGIGAAIPAGGAALRAVGRKAVNSLASVTNPKATASRVVTNAMEQDQMGTGTRLMPGDEDAALRNDQVLTNVDRGGEATRAVARSAANQNPEARAMINRLSDDRFASQASRTREFMNRLMGGQIDDLAYRDAIREAAAASNGPAYRKAFDAAEGKALMTPELDQLLNAPAFRTAVQGAEKASANRAVVEGFEPVRNPFIFNGNQVRLRRNADGSVAIPDLRFWDQVKRNLDTQIEQAQRGAKPDRTAVATLKAMKRQLTNVLDGAVPAYKQARAGAFEAFQAEDALEAGSNFFRDPKNIPEAQRAIARMNTEQREAFATGFVSDLLDTVRASGDRRNVISQVFGSEARREQVKMALGAARAREVEQFVRIENVMDQLRGAMGNSTTARQLMELGMGGAGGYAVTGDWKGALTGAGLARAARFANTKVSERVFNEVARILLSTDETVLRNAIAQGQITPAQMRALEDVSKGLQIMARGGAQTMLQDAS